MKQYQRLIAVFLIVVLVAAPLLSQPVFAAEDDIRPGYLTLEEAAEYVRKELAAQKSFVTVKFYLEDPHLYPRYSMVDVLLEEAFKHTGVPDEGDYLKWSFHTWGGDEKDEFDGQTHYVTVQIQNPIYNATAAQEKELDAKLAEVMASLDLEGKTDYEKIEAIYLYVCQNVRYAEEILWGDIDPLMPPEELNVYYSAYGALVQGEAVCEGFASLIYRMMLSAGIDCRLIAGDNHGWNIVKLDGMYYYLDATWDSGQETWDWFLNGSASFRLGGKETGGTYSAGEHKAWYYQYNSDFLAEYPISVLDYGEEDLSLVAPSTVLGSGKCGDAAKWTLTADGKLTITGYGDMWDASAPGVWWLSNSGLTEKWDGLNGYIQSVEVQQGITSIGDYAFMNCPLLSDISLPASVSSIGLRAFALCESLTNILLPDTVKTVDEGAFYQCVGLKSAVLSAGMKDIPKDMFIGCMDLQTVHIPEGIQTIGEAAFHTCSSLGSIEFPGSLTTLGAGAFGYAFDEAQNISLTIPENVTQIEWACFEASNLHEVIWNAKTQSVPFVTFNLCFHLENIVFCDSITTIEQLAMVGCANLKSVKLPANLQKIGEEAFSGCRALKNMIIPSGVTEVGYRLFGNCTSLEFVTFLGDAPNAVLPEGETKLWAFSPNQEITIYYPQGNSTYDQVFRDLVDNGSIHWCAMHGADEEHTLQVTPADNGQHLISCTGCQEISRLEAHSYSDPCDNSCDGCGAKRSISHRFDDGWQQNAGRHWKVCSDCGYSTSPTSHNFDDGVTQNGSICYTCRECGYTKTEPVTPDTQPTAPSAPDTQPTAPTLPATQPDPADNDNGNTTIILIAVVVALAIGGTAVVLVLKKRK